MSANTLLEVYSHSLQLFFSTKDWFCGRQFFHGLGCREDDSGGNASNGEQQMNVHSLAHHSPSAVLPHS